MRLTPPAAKCCKRFVLLAPHHSAPRAFPNVDSDRRAHEHLLAETQRLRGRIYLEDGAIQSSDLTLDGRHVQGADDVSWHLLTVNELDRVLACLRFRMHEANASFRDLSIYHSPLAKSKTWGELVRRAIEDELSLARRRGHPYLEVGGWAISHALRCTREAVRMVATVYGLSQMFGGALGLSTATVRHGSASILRRLGGKPLIGGGKQLPPYHDPQYRCHMEILRFDSAHPSPGFAGWIDRCLSELRSVQVIHPKSAGHSHSFLTSHHLSPRHERDLCLSFDAVAALGSRMKPDAMPRHAG